MARSDDFDRADDAASLGTPSDSGSDWEARFGTWGIDGGHAYNPSANEHASAVLESGLADGRLRVTIAAGGANAAEVWCRVSDALNGIMCHHHGGAWHMYAHVGGGFNSLGDASGTAPNGAVIGLDFDGDEVTFLVDETAVIGPVTVTHNQAATKHGIGAFASITVRYDDFSIDPPPAGGPIFRRDRSPRAGSRGVG